MLNKDVHMLRLFALSGLVLTACYEKAPPAAAEQRTTQAGGSILLDTEDNDNDGFSELMGDCNDSDPSIAPDAEEICDDIDNDCDGLIDEEATDGVTGYVDADNDGFGDSNMPVHACPAWFSDPYVDHLSLNDLDCNDEDPAINPEAREVCDDIDSDCNPDNDDSGADGTPVYADADGDGFGVSPKTGMICLDADFPELGFPSEPEPGTSLFANDCDDADETTHPTADEYCNETDNDCDGIIDNAAVDRVEWFHDADGDGFGNADVSLGIYCSLPGMADNGDDCDDADASIHPDAVEICDGMDNDCNGGDDEGLTNVYFLDSDNDGYGDPSAPGEYCDDPGEGFSDNNEDCNDADAGINPGAEDTAGDEVDQNCDGIELCFVDADDDGWTADSPAIISSPDALCSGPGEAMATAPAGDCDDTDAALGSIDFDADCDGTLTGEDCDDNDDTSTIIATDGDCDGVLTADDCDDGDNTSTIVATDGDCDGTLTDEDCDDDDAAVPATDADCDGVLTADDCDDNDPHALPGIAYLEEASSDCMRDFDGDGWGEASPSEGISAGTDCDDDDIDRASILSDADCDGSETADDCDDDDATLSEEDEDEDGQTSCDGDCDDEDAYTFIGAAELDDDLDACMRDHDEDGYGDINPPEGVTPGVDCDDEDATIGSVDFDADCDGTVSEDDCDDDNHSLSEEDLDGDGLTSCGGDCDDLDPDVLECPVD
jgi:hypothetical protein